MKNFSVWSRSRLFLPGADPSRSEPESAPGPRPSGAGAAQKSGGSATLMDIPAVCILVMCIAPLHNFSGGHRYLAQFSDGLRYPAHFL